LAVGVFDAGQKLYKEILLEFKWLSTGCSVTRMEKGTKGGKRLNTGSPEGVFI
jgi:hypothetical protein